MSSDLHTLLLYLREPDFMRLPKETLARLWTHALKLSDYRLSSAVWGHLASEVAPTLPRVWPFLHSCNASEAAYIKTAGIGEMRLIEPLDQGHEFFRCELIDVAYLRTLLPQRSTEWGQAQIDFRLLYEADKAQHGRRRSDRDDQTRIRRERRQVRKLVDRGMLDLLRPRIR